MERFPIVIIGLTMLISGIFCKSVAVRRIPVDDLLYSGLWKDITSKVPKGSLILQQYNCDLHMIDTLLELKPRSTGTCSLIIKCRDEITNYSWKVIQMPDPYLYLGTPYTDLFVNWYSADSYFINPKMKRLINGVAYNDIKNLYSYKMIPGYNVMRFTISIYDSSTTLVYRADRNDCFFSCQDFETYKNYASKKGTKVVIDNVHVAFPDFTIKVMAMDTLTEKQFFKSHY